MKEMAEKGKEHEEMAKMGYVAKKHEKHEGKRHEGKKHEGKRHEHKKHK